MHRNAIWLSQITAVISLILIAYVRGRYVFTFGATAGQLLLIATLTNVFTLIFGIAALPRWQGKVSLSIFVFVAYCLLFVPMYVIGCN
jgi:hypothetical protein